MGEDFIDVVQSLLDAGNSPNKVADILNVYHAKINRMVNGGLVEVYTAFDEVDKKHLCQNFEWLWEEDHLEEICNEAFDEFKVNIHEALSENYVSVGRYVREEYGNLFNYLRVKKKSHLADCIYKQCLTCNKECEIKLFSRKKNGLYGVNTQCNLCQNSRLKEYYRDNEEYRNKLKVASKVWSINNKERFDLIMKKAYHKRLARKKMLPDDLTAAQLAFTLGEFDGRCAFTGESNTHLDHVIPLSIGHGGTTYGNMIPLRADLNISKNNHNIFEWFEANRQRFELSQERFDTLIAWLASANAMTVEEYREYVNWCHANTRDIGELEAK